MNEFQFFITVDEVLCIVIIIIIVIKNEFHRDKNLKQNFRADILYFTRANVYMYFYAIGYMYVRVYITR